MQFIGRCDGERNIGHWHGQVWEVGGEGRGGRHDVVGYTQCWVA